MSPPAFYDLQENARLESAIANRQLNDALRHVKQPDVSAMRSVPWPHDENVIALTHAEYQILQSLRRQASTSFEEQRQPLMGRVAYAGASSLVANAIVELVRGRRTGPVQVLSKIAKDWQLSDAELARLLAYRDLQSAVDLLDGRISLRDADREDRVRLLFRIYRILFSLFPEPACQQAWLRGANQNLHNKSPLEFMMERRIPGIVSVQNLVERLAGR
jgi:Protein of unknown function (DUF2384)